MGAISAVSGLVDNKNILNNQMQPNQTVNQSQQLQQSSQQEILQNNNSSNRQYNDNPLKIKNILDQLNG